MSERRGIGTILGWLTVAIACAALFLVPSAWLVDHGQSRWLALAAGLAAFPVVPLVWHLLAERRRARAEGAKSSLTRSDRFALRLIAVALVAVVPFLVLAPGSTWGAVKRQATWFLHWGGGDGDPAGWETPAGKPIRGDARLIGYLPDDAEVVVWLRATREFLESMKKQFGGEASKDDPDAVQEALMALRKDGFLMLVRSRKGLDEVSSEEREKLEQELADNLFGGRRIRLLVYSAQPDLHVVVTENWDAAVRARAAGTRPPPAELLALLETTPADAPLVAAARNAAPAGIVVDRATGHMRVAEKGLRVEAELHLASASAAGLLRGALRGWLDEVRGKAPASCKEPVGKLTEGVDIAGDGATLQLSARLGFEELMSSMFCSLGGDDR
ncbi:MAG TPA: hypothetical protein VFU21_08330 [Kofleriaceae bacterium]|nr:hypothetical protein [Kofleriaceae bacterium]